MTSEKLKDALDENAAILDKIKEIGSIKGIGLIEDLIKGGQQGNPFYEFLMKSLPGISYVLDDKLKLHLWHMNAEVITGYSPGEFLGKHKTWQALFRKWELPMVKKAIEDVFKGGAGIIEAQIIAKDGRGIPFLLTGVRAEFENKPYLVGVGIDISKRKEAESALMESEALYRAFAERMTEGVALLNGSRILFCNKAFAKLLNYPVPNELTGEDVLSFVNKDFEIYITELISSLETGKSTERFFQARWIKDKDKEQDIWVEGRCNVIRWRGRAAVLLTARDITETKLREISMEAEAAHLRKENVTLRTSLIKDRYRFGDIVGKSSAMHEIYELMFNSAATNANIILYGESGTGKELVAKAIHKLSSRSAKSFVPVNCAAIPENLIESEFFGYKKGAFTGALFDKPGFLDLADGGTLFLDEVGEVGLNIQAKLLRAIDGGGYTPVGSNQARQSDFRIIAATNKNLLELSKRGLFREDFFYRIHIIPIYLPALRKRREDIPLLVEHFMRMHCPGKRIPTLPGKVLETLVDYDWPGNIRELQNVIQRFITFGRINFISPIECEPTDYWATTEREPEKVKTDFNLHEQTGNLEKEVIMETLKKYNWNKSKAANALMISRKTLTRKLKKLGLM